MHFLGGRLADGDLTPVLGGTFRQSPACFVGYRRLLCSSQRSASEHLAAEPQGWANGDGVARECTSDDTQAEHLRV